MVNVTMTQSKVFRAASSGDGGFLEPMGVFRDKRKLSLHLWWLAFRSRGHGAVSAPFPYFSRGTGCRAGTPTSRRRKRIATRFPRIAPRGERAERAGLLPGRNAPLPSTAAPTERHAGEHRLVRFLAARQGRCRSVQEGPVRTLEEHAGQAGKRVRRDELILYCCQPIPADVVADGWSACPRPLQGCQIGRAHV